MLVFLTLRASRSALLWPVRGRQTTASQATPRISTCETLRAYVPACVNLLYPAILFNIEI
jgi:hypothetical protein